jgi:hypothetical protein
MLGAMRAFNMEGMHVDDVVDFLRRSGVETDGARRVTLPELRTTLAGGTNESAIVMIARHPSEGLQGLQAGSNHFVLVEGFADAPLARAAAGGVPNLEPVVRLVDSNEAARLLVSLREFSQRFNDGSRYIIPIRRGT